MRIVFALLIALAWGTGAKAATHYVNLFTEGAPDTGFFVFGPCYCGGGTVTPFHIFPEGDTVDFGSVIMFPTEVSTHGVPPQERYIGTYIVMSPVRLSSQTPVADQSYESEITSIVNGMFTLWADVPYPADILEPKLHRLTYSGGPIQLMIYGGFEYIPPEAPQAVPLPPAAILFASVAAFVFVRVRRRHHRPIEASK